MNGFPEVSLPRTPWPRARTTLAGSASTMRCVNPIALERMLATWDQVRSRFEAYELVVPGIPSFVCQAENCVAHCCRVFSVALNDQELSRLERFSGLERIELLEYRDGAPVTLPLADPYLLGRRDGHCAMLREDLLCGQYEGRPDACRLYPHHVMFIDMATGRPANPDLDAFRGSLAGADDRQVPLLMRHLECPGFTGSAIQLGEWQALLLTTYRLQYHDETPLPAALAAQP